MGDYRSRMRAAGDLLMFWVFIVLFFLSCCCIGCSGYCIFYGLIRATCTTESGEFYLATPSGPPALDPIAFPAECCQFPVNPLGLTAPCLWTTTDNGCDWELEITGTTAEFRQIIDGYHTIVWVNNDYDPLCPQMFILDEANSTLPDDCNYYERACIAPFNGCCDSAEFRSEPIPIPLFGKLTYCFGETTGNTAYFDVTVDPATGFLVAVIEDVAGGDLTISIECICEAFNAGCGTSAADPCFILTWSHSACGTSGVEGWGTCDCNPFNLVFALGDAAASCCAAEFAVAWELEISEDTIP